MLLVRSEIPKGSFLDEVQKQSTNADSFVKMLTKSQTEADNSEGMPSHKRTFCLPITAVIYFPSYFHREVACASGADATARF